MSKSVQGPYRDAAHPGIVEIPREHIKTIHVDQGVAETHSGRWVDLSRVRITENRL